MAKANVKALAKQVKALAKRCEKVEARIGARTLPIEPDRLYKPSEVAARLRCGKGNVHDLADSNLIRHHLIGTDGHMRPRFRGSDILAFLCAKEEGGLFTA